MSLFGNDHNDRAIRIIQHWVLPGSDSCRTFYWEVKSFNIINVYLVEMTGNRRKTRSNHHLSVCDHAHLVGDQANKSMTCWFLGVPKMWRICDCWQQHQLQLQHELILYVVLLLPSFKKYLYPLTHHVHINSSSSNYLTMVNHRHDQHSQIWLTQHSLPWLTMAMPWQCHGRMAGSNLMFCASWCPGWTSSWPLSSASEPALPPSQCSG